MHLDSTCLNNWGGVVGFVLGVLPQLPPNSAEWEELLAEGIHLCKINKEAELSAQATMPFYPQCERRATVMRSECVRRFRCEPQEAYL